jgi:tetratricopeptide (TPR) repeat protein
MNLNRNNPDTQETQELIDAYLMDGLSPEEKAEVELQMRLFPDFRNQVEVQSMLSRGIEEFHLKNSLNEFHEEMAGAERKKRYSYTWLALAASVLILIGLGTWAILGTSNSPQKIFAATFKPDPGLPTTMSTTSDYEFYFGMVNYKRKEYSEAISKWEALYAANPQNDTVIYFLGVANLANGNARQATNYLKMAQDFDQSVFYEDTRYYLALALLKENKIEEAQKILSQSKSPQSKVLLKKIAAL